MNTDDYPLTRPLSFDVERWLSKGAALSIIVDMLRAEHGENLISMEISGLIADRLDILHHNGLVPRKLPRSVPRCTPDALAEGRRLRAELEARD